MFVYGTEMCRPLCYYVIFTYNVVASRATRRGRTLRAEENLLPKVLTYYCKKPYNVCQYNVCSRKGRPPLLQLGLGAQLLAVVSDVVFMFLKGFGVIGYSVVTSHKEQIITLGRSSNRNKGWQIKVPYRPRRQSGVYARIIWGIYVNRTLNTKHIRRIVIRHI
jgi:hypothetical protein